MLESVEGITFNGVNLVDEFTDGEGGSAYFIVNEVYGRGISEVENTLITITGMDGAYPTYTRRPPRNLSVSITMKGESFEDLRRRLERLNEILYTDGEDVPITFDDEPNRTYYGRLNGFTNVMEKSKIYKATILIICSDPDKIGEEKSATFSEDAVVVNNEGTADTFPIIELTATEKTTFAMVTNGDEYNMVGRPAEVDEVVVDEKTTLFDEKGDTVNEWDTGGQGNFNADSNGIFVSSYGSGSEWHGPTLQREVSPTEDFEIEFFTSVRTERDLMTFRTSLNFYDENMNELGLLRVWDKSNKRTAKIIEARIGSYTGTAHENYLISSNNYLWENQRVYNGIIRVTRVGRKWTFYAAHISQRGNHTQTIKRTFNDINNEFTGRLKFIRIGASIHGSNPTPNALSIQRVRVFSMNKVEIDQTPYIIFPNDIVIFDHENEDVLINGEARNDLKNFGASYFKLHKGYNTIVVSPENSFDSEIKFRERYK